MNEIGDTFDILGVAWREDTYTDLIVDGLNNNVGFRRGFLKMLGESDDGKWKALSRKRATRKNGKADVPDIVLFNKSTHALLLIENKVGAAVDVGQLKRYRERECTDRIAERFEIPIRMKKPKVVLLTLDDSTESSVDPSVFNSITYRDLAKPNGPLSSVRGGDDLSRLLRELRIRALGRYDWHVRGAGSLKEAIETPGGSTWCDEKYRFHSLVRQSIDLDEYSVYYGTTHVPGKGAAYLVNWWRPDWDSSERFGGDRKLKSGNNVYRIYCELQWITYDAPVKLWLALRYSTNPYMSKKQRKELDDSLISGYESTRRRFCDHLLSDIPDGWKRPSRLRDLTVLEHEELDADLPCNAISKQVNSAIAIADAAIDSSREFAMTRNRR